MEHTKDAYLANMNQVVKVGRYTCTVREYRKEGRSGSWERGFKFTNSVYGMLVRKLKTHYCTEYSCDHGATWHPSASAASKVRAGKVLLSRTTQGEFAFDSIQRINKQYDPNYTWRP